MREPRRCEQGVSDSNYMRCKVTIAATATVAVQSIIIARPQHFKFRRANLCFRNYLARDNVLITVPAVCRYTTTSLHSCGSAADTKVRVPFAIERPRRSLAGHTESQYGGPRS